MLSTCLLLIEGHVEDVGGDQSAGAHGSDSPQWRTTCFTLTRFIPFLYPHSVINFVLVLGRQFVRVGDLSLRNLPLPLRAQFGPDWARLSVTKPWHMKWVATKTGAPQDIATKEFMHIMQGLRFPSCKMHKLACSITQGREVFWGSFCRCWSWGPLRMLVSADRPDAALDFAAN